MSDPTGRIANWDQRGAVAADGRLVSFSWTYDFEAVAYRDIRRRISADEGRTFGEPTELGFADQPGHPGHPPGRAGRPRLGRSLRVALDPGSPGGRASTPRSTPTPRSCSTRPTVRSRATPSSTETTGDALVEMQAWSYGLAFAETLPDGDVGVVHYAPGQDGGLDVRWVRLAVDG